MDAPVATVEGALEGAWLDLERGWVVRGWAREIGSPRPLDLEIVLDAGDIVPVRADRPHDDLAGVGAHAFETVLPAALATARRRLRLRVAGTGEHLPDYRGAVWVTRRYGVIERCDNVKLEGWCVDLAAPDATPVVEIRDETDVLAVLCCRDDRWDLDGLATRPRAFSYTLPEALWDGTIRKLTLRFAGTDEALRGSPFTHRFATTGRTAALGVLKAELARLDAEKAALQHRLDLQARCNWADPRAYGHWLGEHHRALAAGLEADAEPVALRAFACPAGGADPGALRRVLGGGAEMMAVTRPGVSLDRPLLDRAVGGAVAPALRPTALAYADEDGTGPDGARCDPVFKTVPDLHRLLCHPWIGSFFVAGRDLLAKVVEAAPGSLLSYEALLLGCVRAVPRSAFVRVRAVLGTRPVAARAAGGAADPAPDWDPVAWRRAVDADVAARRLAVRVEPTAAGPLRLRWPLPDPPPEVAVVVPTRNRHGLLRVGLGSLFERTTYPRWRLVVVDNGSDDPQTRDHLAALARRPRVTVLRDDGDFNFSRLNNRAVAAVDSPLVCLLNNDVEVVTPDWLEEMAGWALRPEVGAVGAKLVYPNGLIQHGGSVIGVWGGADNTHHVYGRDDTGYNLDLVAARRVSAVTAACLVCRRTQWEAVGGLDETAFPVNFNDVDFCLKLGARGLANIWTPHAELVHHESLSRGWTSAHRSAEAELKTMQARWNTDTADDPFYSPNFSRWHEPFTRLAPMGGWAPPNTRA